MISTKKREYYKKNIERIKEERKKWREDNKVESREWRENNKDKIKYYSTYRKQIGQERYNINTCSDELKPVIKQLIDIKNAKIELREKRKKVEKGEI